MISCEIMLPIITRQTTRESNAEIADKYVNISFKKLQCNYLNIYIYHSKL